jgi:hypothetical protein
MVSLAGAVDVGVMDVGGVEAGVGLAVGGEAVGNVTRSPPLVQPAVARTSKSAQQARLLITHSYRIRSGHACDRAARP